MDNPISPSKRSVKWDIPIAEVIIFVVAGIVCWILGYRSWSAFGIALMIAGSGVILAGIVSFVLGSGPVAREYRLASIPPGMKGPDHYVATITSGWSCALLYCLSGLISLGLGFLITKLAML